MKKQTPGKKRKHNRNIKKFNKWFNKRLWEIKNLPRKESKLKYSLEDLLKGHREMIDAGFFDDPIVKAETDLWMNSPRVGRELL